MRNYRCFNGDNNEALIDVQYYMYKYLVGKLFERAKEIWTIAAIITGADPGNIEKVKQADGFDHRTLQPFHDAIATAYRYDHREQQDEFDFINKSAEETEAYFKDHIAGWGSDDHVSKAKQFSDQEYRIAFRWYNYFEGVLHRFFTFDEWDNVRLGILVRNIMDAAVFHPNKPQGSEAEEILVSIVFDHYDDEGLPEAIEQYRNEKSRHGE